MPPSTEPLPFAAIPFIDHHGHPWLRRWRDLDAAGFRACFSESPSADLVAAHLSQALPYRRALRDLAALLGCSPAEELILAARQAGDPAGYLTRLFAGANIAQVLLDDGYPPPMEALSVAEVSQATGLPARRLLRLETLVEDITRRTSDFPTLVAQFDDTIGSAAERGVAALKSIAAYRSGLRLAPVDDATAAETWRAWRDQARAAGAYRLATKPVVDFFVLRAVAQAARQGPPVQFHTGYGDPDLDLREANPLHLRPLLEDRRFGSATVVLLHGAYPYTREAAYLAAVYPRVYLDVSTALPPLGLGEIVAMLTQALGVAPASKLLLSSDSARIPEHHALGAWTARRALALALEQAVRQGDLAREEMEDVASWLLWRTAAAIYPAPEAT